MDIMSGKLMCEFFFEFHIINHLPLPLFCRVGWCVCAHERTPESENDLRLVFFFWCGSTCSGFLIIRTRGKKTENKYNACNWTIIKQMKVCANTLVTFLSLSLLASSSSFSFSAQVNAMHAQVWYSIHGIFATNAHTHTRHKLTKPNKTKTCS